jgi:hypothetical protein
LIFACPDARLPAYQAAVGVAGAGLLDALVTESDYDPDARLAAIAAP